MKKLLATLSLAACAAFTASAATVNLANVTADTTLNNGDVAYGTLSRSVKISIATGATVTISNATINIGGDSTTKWAGLTCNGYATIILEGNNTVYGPYQYPAIYVSPGARLTIKGGGSLEATGGDQAAGIGGGNFNARLNTTSILSDGNCGHIFIEGGDITAFGGAHAAGIGSGQSYSCGNIVISGGTVKATAGSSAAGIGASSAGSCGSITITGGNVTATGVDYGPGIGAYDSFRCGIVYIGEGIKMVRAVRNIKCSPRLLLGENLIQNDSTKNGVSVSTITSRVVNLADITANTVIEDDRIITGTLGGNYKISIADGATVTLRDATINGVNSESCKWAGITCIGNATIILEGGNTVTGFHEDYPGIYVPVGKTLTIKGDGSLNASGSLSNSGYRWAPGIGGGCYIDCGNIRIEGGTIKAAGGFNAANIGGGSGANCGDITITKGVTGMVLIQPTNGYRTIGGGYGGTVGTVTVGGVVGEISQNPYVYAPNRVNLASKTSDYTAADGDVMYGETTHTVTVPAGANVMINGIEVMGEHDVVIDLGDVNADTTIADGTVVTGTLSANVKVSIADGATVTLRDATINGVNDQSYEWAGITCEGDATIKLEGSNTVKGFHENYPGIYVPANKTLTINGSGVLNASSNGYAPGIGGAYYLSCGNIRIEGGKINAKGGRFSAGIGGGAYGDCGDITITEGATSVTAEKGAAGDFSIGRGNDDRSCGTVTIGGVVGEISQSPYTYYGILPAPAFAADGKAATTEFVKGANGTWTLTTFAEMSNDALGSGVADGQIKVYAAPTVEGLNNASPMTSGVTVKGKKSAVMTTIEVTPPGNPPTQFFKVKFGE
ncbi:MAG: hypothetical protein K6F50_09540 [Kiritimatiellae bacterium]|nr:hypothetical protein [Kiritimatiellia bacterium]